MGKKYKALTGLSYPTDKKIIKRLQDGEKVPMDKRKMKRVEAGEVVDDIPASSIEWLKSQGLVEEVE